MNIKRVIIIGSGIAGASMALFLNRLGIHSELYEMYEKRTDIGGGLQIAPNGMRVLAALGLADVIEQKGAVSSAMRFHNEKGKLLAKVTQDARKKYGFPAVNIARSSFHETLIDELEKHGIVVHYNKKLKKIVEEEAGATAVFEDGTKAHGDFLIGADGIHSKTREYVAGNDPKPVYTGLQNAGGFAPAAALENFSAFDESATCFTFGRKGFFGFALCNKKPGEEVMWWSNIPEQREVPREQLRLIDAEEIKEELLQLHRHWHAPIERIIEQSSGIFKSSIHDIESLPRWSKNRVVLIGDAAHAMSPHAGQGASAALEDSMYLAKLIKDRDLPIENIFDIFEKGRKERAEKIIKAARRNGAGKKELGPAASWLRDKLLSIVLPVFAGKGQDWIHGYEIQWDEGIRP